MVKYIISLIFLVQFAQAQERLVNRGTLKIDKNKKSFSTLDLMYLITKAIHPGAYLHPGGDTLHFRFDIPPGPVDSADLIYARNVSFDAIAEVALNKDSINRYSIGAFAICSGFPNCVTWLYRLKDNKYRNRSFSEKIGVIIPAFYWPTEASTFTGDHEKKSILLFHQVDTNNIYSRSYYLQSFCQTTDLIIGDIVYRSNKKIKTQYEYVINIFYCGEKLLSYSRFKIDSEFPEIYSSMLFNSSIVK